MGGLQRRHARKAPAFRPSRLWDGKHALPSIVFSCIRIGYAEFFIDRDREPVEEPFHIGRVLLVQGSRLVPDHHLAEPLDEFVDLGSPELFRHDEVVEVVRGAEECSLGGGRPKCRESSIRLTTNLCRIRSLQAYYPMHRRGI